MFKRKRKKHKGKRPIRVTTIIALLAIGYVAYRVMWDPTAIIAGLSRGSW